MADFFAVKMFLFRVKRLVTVIDHHLILMYSREDETGISYLWHGFKIPIISLVIVQGSNKSRYSNLWVLEAVEPADLSFT